MSHIPEKWKFKPTPKCGRQGFPRLIPSSETVKKVMPLLKEMEIMNAHDMVRVDDDDVPVYICRRSRQGGDSYYKGKGCTQVDSRASALMESVERYSGEGFHGEIVTATHGQICEKGPAVDPADLYTRMEKCYSPECEVEWVQGFDLIGEEPIWIPLNLAVFPYKGREYFRSGTVGLASGNTMEEAVAHALFEVIEHDALGVADTYNPWSYLFEERNDDGTVKLHNNVPFKDPTPKRAFPLIDHRTFPPRAARIAKKFKDAGLVFFARNITTDIRVAAVVCMLAAPDGQGRYYLYKGMGAHLNARIALERALCEAAQSRSVALWLQQRNLMSTIDPVEDPWSLEDYSALCSFSDIPSRENDTVDQDIRDTLARLRAAGLGQAVAVDLTKPELGIPVVRVTVPGTEYLYDEPDKKGMGPRAEKSLKVRTHQANTAFRQFLSYVDCGRGPRDR